VDQATPSGGALPPANTEFALDETLILRSLNRYRKDRAQPAGAIPPARA
jgi:hypothetical protein